MSTDCWDKLNGELDHWTSLGRKAELWWRDDDAQHPETDLRRLIALSRQHDVPVSLAVSPALGSPALIQSVHHEFHCTILQHGYAHLNHAPQDQKKAELGNHRPVQQIESELQQGFALMQRGFGSLFLPVMVPPWNRINAAVIDILSEIGFGGISEYLARSESNDHGLVRCNTHVDIVNWRNNAQFAGTERSIELLIDHLAGKRTGIVDPLEPTGLLTHHLQHDEAAWVFIDELLTHTRSHPAVSWQSAEKAFSG